MKKKNLFIVLPIIAIIIGIMFFYAVFSTTSVNKNRDVIAVGETFTTTVTSSTPVLLESLTYDATEMKYEIKFDQPIDEFEFRMIDPVTYKYTNTKFDTQWNSDKSGATLICKKNCDKSNYLVLYHLFYEVPYIIIDPTLSSEVN